MITFLVVPQLNEACEHTITATKYTITLSNNTSIANSESGRFASLCARFESLPADLFRQVKRVYESVLHWQMPPVVVVSVHEGLAIVGRDGEGEALEVILARATPQFRGAPYHSKVAIQGEESDGTIVEWYGECVTFIKVLARQGGEERQLEYAVIKYYEKTGIEPRTSFPLVRWENRALELVELPSILRLVQVLPMGKEWAKQTNRYLVNLDKKYQMSDNIED